MRILCSMNYIYYSLFARSGWQWLPLRLPGGIPRGILGHPLQQVLWQGPSPSAEHVRADHIQVHLGQQSPVLRLPAQLHNWQWVVRQTGLSERSLRLIPAQLHNWQWVTRWTGLSERSLRLPAQLHNWQWVRRRTGLSERSLRHHAHLHN